MLDQEHGAGVDSLERWMELGKDTKARNKRDYDEELMLQSVAE